MLPVATPPNAIVFSSGALTIPQMIRAGILMNLMHYDTNPACGDLGPNGFFELRLTGVGENPAGFVSIGH